MTPMIAAVLALVSVVAAGCGSAVMGATPAGVGAWLPAEAPGGAPPGTPPQPPMQYPGSYFTPPHAQAFGTNARLGLGLVVPTASTLGPAATVDASVDLTFGFYSLGAAIGYYQVADDALGGHVSVLPIRLSIRMWTNSFVMQPRGFLGIAFGPYLCDHSRPDVIYDSSVGLDISAGAELLLPGDRLLVGMELGYTVNQPGITISGIPGDENLDVFFIKVSVAVGF